MNSSEEGLAESSKVIAFDPIPAQLAVTNLISFLSFAISSSRQRVAALKNERSAGIRRNETNDLLWAWKLIHRLVISFNIFIIA